MKPFWNQILTSGEMKAIQIFFKTLRHYEMPFSICSQTFPSPSLLRRPCWPPTFPDYCLGRKKAFPRMHGKIVLAFYEMPMKAFIPKLFTDARSKSTGSLVVNINMMKGQQMNLIWQLPVHVCAHINTHTQSISGHLTVLWKLLPYRIHWHGSQIHVYRYFL